MEAAIVDARQSRGLALAKAKGRKIKPVAGTTWLVPSASGTGGYTVDVETDVCSCPDYEERRERCKHSWAIAFVRREVAMPDGTVLTETRITYSQDWPAYNRAQTTEIEHARLLLKELCAGIPQPPQAKGRPRLPLADVVMGEALKVYGTLSGRRSSSEIRACKERGLAETAPSYNTLFRYLASPALTPILKSLVEESAKPLREVETTFAVDATGLATSTYARWFDHKYGEERRVQQWVKLHASVGVVTNVIVAAEVTSGHVHDSVMMPALVATTAANFDMRTVVADKGYLGHDNLTGIETLGATPLMPFKINSTPGGSPAWERLWNFCAMRKVEFLRRYHQRSNVESTFSALKRKFGASVRSKTPTAQVNEALVKCIAFNVSTLVHALHEMNVTPAFWQGAL